MGLVRKALLWVGLVVWLFATGRAWAVEATLVADAHVNSALPGVNSGSISNLNVGAGYTALLQFDLSLLPSGTTSAQVSRAVLRLYCNRVDTAGQVSVHLVNGAWGEYSVTYATLPALGSVAQTVQVDQAGTYLTLDVTALVQGWITDPTTNNGLALTADTAAVQFDSKENDLTAHAAMLDVTLATTGPAGAVGPAGPIGLTGPAGAAGAVGATGATGATGPSGSMGPMGPPGVAGPAGAKGDTGATGPAGPMGPTGVQGFQGVEGQQGMQGVAGPAGAVGPMGPAGAKGDTGSAGPAGPAGPVGMVFRGSYAPTTNYGLNDAVSYLGSSYISMTANNQGNSPGSNPAVWSVVALQGAAGAQGPAGTPGAAGATGAQGASGPQGPQGVPGTAGAAGAVGMNYRGVWQSGVGYQANDAVSFAGSTYLAQVGNFGMEPDLDSSAWAVLAQKGGAGPTGPAGAAATVSVGTVTTGAAGSPATVTNSGTATAAVLNFNIPQGAAGANGTGGGSGSGGGILSGSMYHAVSFSYHFYSVSNTNQSASEDPSVLTWVPAGCTATSLSAYSQQSNVVTVTLRQGTLGNMADTALTCAPAVGGSCTVTGSVVVAPGNFVDFGVSNSSGAAAGVWMAVACN